MGYVTEFIKHVSKRSQIVAHQLIWNMQTNMYMDEDQQHRDRKSSLFILSSHRKRKFFPINSPSVRRFGGIVREYNFVLFGSGETFL